MSNNPYQQLDNNTNAGEHPSAPSYQPPNQLAQSTDPYAQQQQQQQRQGQQSPEGQYGAPYAQPLPPPPQQQPYGYQPPNQQYGVPPVMYAAPAGPYVVQVAGQGFQNPGHPGHLPRGMFSDGICDFMDSVSICLLSWCISPVRWATTQERLQFTTFTNALLIYGLPWLMMIGFDVVFDITNYWIWAIPSLVCNIISIIIGTVYRGKLRQRYQIQGSDFEDCLLHTFCRCCAIAQEARHVDRDHAIPI